MKKQIDSRISISEIKCEMLDDLCSLGAIDYENQLELYSYSGDFVNGIKIQKKKEALQSFWERLEEIKKAKKWE